MIAKTQLGLEEVLAQELRLLGAQDVSVLNRAVSFVETLVLRIKLTMLAYGNSYFTAYFQMTAEEIYSFRGSKKA